MLDSSMKAFCETYKFRSLAKEASCFKNQESPSSILTNKHLSFLRLCAIETELSEFHKILLTVMKMHFPKRKHVSLHTENMKAFVMKHS